MFTESTKEKAWSLYQASIKHSSEAQDYKKMIEESIEYKKAKKTKDSKKICEEFTDKIIMLLRDYCHTIKPRCYSHFELEVENMAEWMDFKHDRTLKRFQEGFYNE